jgi:putative transcriptional regulator, merR family
MTLIKIKNAMIETGLTRKALRYYDEKNLVVATKITVGKNNAWYYTENDVKVLKKIKLYRDLDIPIEQIKEILTSENGEAIFKENIANLLAKRKDNLKKQTEIARHISDNSIIDSM